MLQYRLIHDTDEFAEGNSERLVLYIIHNDITYEHHVSDKYDTSRVIQYLKDFTIEYANVYINASYYSMTFRLMPIGENIQLIISLRNKIAELEKQIQVIPKSIPMQKPPKYLPPNLTLRHEIQYLPWDTLEDLFYMYPLDTSEELYKSFHKNISSYNGAKSGRYTYEGYSVGGLMLYSHRLFIDGLQFFKIDIDTFDPNDMELNRFIEENKSEPYCKLSKSCKQPFTYNKKINIHILNFISYISRYYILQTGPGLGSKPPFIHCYVNSSHLYIRIFGNTGRYYKSEIYGDIGIYHVNRFPGTLSFHKYRMNFYINDWSAPPVVVYV
jgi:hypothetical protein